MTLAFCLRAYWDTKKRVMHIWVPHTALAEIDYQLDEAIGYLYTQDYEGALPKIEVILGLSENIPKFPVESETCHSTDTFFAKYIAIPAKMC